MQRFPITGFSEERDDGAYYGRSPATHETWARGDRSLLPLGAVWADSTSRAGSLRPSFASAKRPSSTNQQGDNKNKLGGGGDSSQPGDCGGAGSSRPIGQPIMTMCAGGTKLAVFLTPPSTTIFNASSQVILALLGSWSWGWRLVSTTGILTGFLAGLLVGLGQRLRPVAGWSWIVLPVAGVALQGRGPSSWALLGVLGLSMLWRHGWWLYRHPGVAAAVFLFTGSAMDMVLGFMASAVFQVHPNEEPKAPPPPPPPLPSSKEASSAPPPAPLETATHSTVGGGPEFGWTAVTPPGLRARSVGFGGQMN